LFGIVGKKWVHTYSVPERGQKPLFQSKSADCVIFRDQNASNTPISVFITRDKNHALLIRGEIYNLETLGCHRESCLAGALWDLYQKHGEDFCSEINGAFILMIWNGSERRLTIIRDKIGLLQCFYTQKPGGLIFGSHPARIKRMGPVKHSLNHRALIQYLLYCYNPGSASLYSEIARLQPACRLTWENGEIRIRKYWELSFDPDPVPTGREWGGLIREALEKAVRIRRGPQKTGAFLSGGLDSSSVVSVLSGQGETGLSTYSFRCKGESFDESHYAKIVSDRFGTRHMLVEYGAEELLKTEAMVTLMDEPFSDVGINVASYLLASAARGKTDLLFTGDGGDELFAGHPVYMADKVGRLFRMIPAFIRVPLFQFGRNLPDSEQKNDWKVKLKRFSESYNFPAQLATQRWRIYYTPQELALLLNEDLFHSISDDIYSVMLQFNQNATGPDFLSRSLHADYQTVVQFYLRRIEIPRALGLSPRMPMLDPELVVLCARIPSKYKIHGWGDTKYIEKIAVEPILPDEIVHRKDKLGHSIPLKNWIRDDSGARSFVGDLVSKASLNKRGLFNPVMVERLWKEHQDRVRNHSHRLWALAVLELWMRAKEF
jgi:asparagine synthase (glutamine-hydrolysing)